MKNLYIYCEGPTEESFINNVLSPYLLDFEVYARPIVCMTKRTNTVKYRGGVSDYRKIKAELSNICRQHKNETVTTMFDYYGFPSNAPGTGSISRSLFERVAYIEKAIEADISVTNLFFNITIHEFEGLLFSDTTAFDTNADAATLVQLLKIREQFTSPEHINNSADSAPSKRIMNLLPGFAKVSDGTIISARIGISAILAECEHFREWIKRIKLISS